MRALQSRHRMRAADTVDFSSAPVSHVRNIVSASQLLDSINVASSQIKTHVRGGEIIFSESCDPTAIGLDQRFWAEKRRRLSSSEPPAKPPSPAVEYGDDGRHSLVGGRIERSRASDLSPSPPVGQAASSRKPGLALTGGPLLAAHNRLDSPDMSAGFAFGIGSDEVWRPLNPLRRRPAPSHSPGSSGRTERLPPPGEVLRATPPGTSRNFQSGATSSPTLMLSAPSLPSNRNTCTSLHSASASGVSEEITHGSRASLIATAPEGAHPDAIQSALSARQLGSTHHRPPYPGSSPCEALDAVRPKVVPVAAGKSPLLSLTGRSETLTEPFQKVVPQRLVEEAGRPVIMPSDLDVPVAGLGSTAASSAVSAAAFAAVAAARVRELMDLEEKSDAQTARVLSPAAVCEPTLHDACDVLTTQGWYCHFR